MLTPQTTPVRLDLKRTEKLEIEWQDGTTCTYPLTLLRSMCPCAMCKEQRESAAKRPKTSLTVLPGNYALRIEWSDQHETGIYSFQYLREICPPAPPKGDHSP